MLGSRLLLLIQAHAGPLTRDAIKDLLTNPRTPTFRRLNPADVESRVSALYYNLGSWIGDANENAIRREYEDTGRIRFRQGVPVSELVFLSQSCIAWPLRNCWGSNFTASRN